MNRKNQTRCLAIALAILAFSSNGIRTTTLAITPSEMRPATPANANPLALLPASDGVLYVDANRLLSDVLPRLLAEDPAILRRLNKDMEEFKRMSGLDPRTIDYAAFGVRLDSQKGKSVKVVGIVRGRFDAPALAADAVARANRSGGAKLKKETYNGKNVYVETVPKDNLSLAVLDANTFVAGDAAMVRETIDCGAAGKCVDTSLITAATKNSDAFIGFAVSKAAFTFLSLMLGNKSVAVPSAGLVITPSDELMRLLASVKEINATISAPGNSVLINATLRAEDAEKANQIAGLFAFMKRINELPEDADTRKQPSVIPFVDGIGELLLLFKGLNVTAQASDVEFKLEMPFARIMRFVRRSSVVAPPPPAVNAPPSSPPAPRRPAR